jgi:hypothetical protein
MSAINGDKARFHRERKQKIQRRLRKHEMFKALSKQADAVPPLSPKAKEGLA